MSRPQGSIYEEAIRVLQNRATLPEIRSYLHSIGMDPTPESAYQRLRDLRQQGRVTLEEGFYSIPVDAPSSLAPPRRSPVHDRMDALLARLVRAGILPIDHGI